ncbi:MAG: hypothetical protein Tsb0021_11020 [Chlamydiales bacterium]
MIQNIINPILYGIGSGHSIKQSKHNEDTLHVGGNQRLRTFYQSLQCYEVVNQVNLLLKLKERKVLPLAVKIGVSIIFPLCHYIIPQKIKQIDHPLARNGVRLLCSIGNQQGKVYNAIFIVVNIALFHQGYALYAISAIAMTAFGFLCRDTSSIPIKIDRKVVNFANLMGDFCALINGNIVVKVIILVDLIPKVLHVSRNILLKTPLSDWLPSSVKSLITPSPLVERPYDPEKDDRHLLSENGFIRIKRYSENTSSHIHEKYNLEREPLFMLNRDHILIDPIPIQADVDVNSILEEFQKFNFHDDVHFEFLKNALENDPRWQSKIASGSIDLRHLDAVSTKTFMIEYVEKMIRILIHSVTQESIQTGNEAVNYPLLKNYLYFIAKQLPKLDEDQKKIVLINLGTSAGDMCGTGVQHTLYETYLLCYVNQKEQHQLTFSSAKRNVLTRLQEERLRILAAYHLYLSKVDLPRSWVYQNETDPHGLNDSISLMDGNSFGLHMNYEDYAILKKGGLIKKILRFLYFRLHPEDLWKDTTLRLYESNESSYVEQEIHGYTVERVLNSIRTEVNQNSSIIPRSTVTAWLESWLKTLDKTTQQEDWEDYLDPEHPDSFYTDEGLSWNDKILIAMLVDMGIFTLSESDYPMIGAAALANDHILLE